MELTNAKINGMSPASPQDPRIWVDGLGGCLTEAVGMTKREEFAAMAMQGLLVKQDVNINNVARLAVDVADRLLNELERTK